MIRTQVYLPEELYYDLKLLAASRRVKFSALIREGISDVIIKKKIGQKKTQRLLGNIIGACKTNVKTNAVEDLHDYYRNDVV